MIDREYDEREEMREASGYEQMDPGTPTRSMNERGEIESESVREVEEIAEQQGATQRGYSGDREEGTSRRAEISPTHPDPSGDPEGDPER